jgi:hypothetical protein
MRNAFKLFQMLVQPALESIVLKIEVIAAKKELTMSPPTAAMFQFFFPVL